METLRAENTSLSSRLDEAETALQSTRAGLASAEQSLAASASGEATEAAQNLRSDLDAALNQVGVAGVSAEALGGDRVGLRVSSGELFGSGRSYISYGGLALMEQLAEVLAAFPDYDIRVEGHTDNVPVGAAIAATFPSNWELSVARAAAAVRYLQEAGFDATRLSAAGFGEYRPIASNDTAEGQGANRRIELILTPR